MLLILSKYSSEKNKALIDDEGTIIQTLTFTLNATIPKMERG